LLADGAAGTAPEAVLAGRTITGALAETLGARTALAPGVVAATGAIDEADTAGEEAAF
jgi:hypothetical protein